MATNKSILAGLAIIISFWIFGQQAYGAGEPNVPAQKQKRVEGELRARRKVPMGDRVRQRMAELSERLNLTEEQKKSIAPIIKNEIKEIDALRADSSASKEEKIEKMKAARESSREAIKKILTPEQQAKLSEAREELKEATHQTVAELAEKRFNALSEKLTLSNEQKQKIKPIIENEMKELSVVKDDESISIGQKQEQMKAIHQKSQEEINKVLTPEQQRKLEMSRKRGKGRITDTNSKN